MLSPAPGARAVHATLPAILGFETDRAVLHQCFGERAYAVIVRTPLLNSVVYG